jgi:3-hydroxybutyryl-CoA dehydrogenase
LSAPRIAVLGAGRMGRGIAHVFAYAGHPVSLIDIKDRPAEAARLVAQEALDEIDASLQSLAEIGAFPAPAVPDVLRRIKFGALAAAPGMLDDAAVVFEAVPEVMETKRAAFAFAAPHLRADAILASTTSTFLVDALADLTAVPQRFLNAHWLNPAYIIPLVELSPGKRTDPAVVRAMKALLDRIGKVPVVCAAAPGFIVPRIQALAMNEAARLVEEGLATAEDIDKATRYGLGFRYAAMGLLEFIDYGGGDILYYASRSLAAAMGDPRFAAPDIIDRHMREGRIGLKRGIGFYDYAGIDVAAYRRDVLRRLVSQLEHLGLLRQPAAVATNHEDDR